jgi:hypothetical protein
MHRHFVLNPAANEKATMDAAAGAAASENEKSKPAILAQSPGLFKIVTDNGDRWTSVDGVMRFVSFLRAEATPVCGFGIGAQGSLDRKIQPLRRSRYQKCAGELKAS